MPPDARLRPADRATDDGASSDRRTDREYVETLLAANDLPVADLGEKLDRLYCWEVGGERVGVGGLERYGDAALLRSVAIEERARGEGHGRALCERLLDEAAESGVETVYLLTTTAPAFFAELGFAETDRGSAPPAIRETSEFSELCPDAAVCMEKELER